MNIELEEVVWDVSDDALEMAAGAEQGGCGHPNYSIPTSFV